MTAATEWPRQRQFLGLTGGCQWHASETPIKTTLPRWPSCSLFPRRLVLLVVHTWIRLQCCSVGVDNLLVMCDALFVCVSWTRGRNEASTTRMPLALCSRCGLFVCVRTCAWAESHDGLPLACSHGCYYCKLHELEMICWIIRWSILLIHVMGW